MIRWPAIRFRTLLSCSLLLLSLDGCSFSGSDPRPKPLAPSAEASGRPIGDARLLSADRSNWLMHGGTYSEQRYSPLSQINESNVDALGLAWSFDMQSERGVESTPLVADGTLYVTAPWSILHALDAATGEHKWTYDPGVPRGMARQICCGVVNRGAALYGNSVFIGTLDGRLVALDRESGREAWSVDTREPEWPYSITGAPRVLEGKVIIGNAGADLGARGYVSAYDAESGELVWRTYTVPGNPAKGFETPAMERAAATWKGEWWKAGGGGTVWDALAYDPELHLLYVGTGNGTPHARWLRSPGGGDNLYLSSILALRPETGELVWHYQTTPGDSWDYTATQHILLADLEIEGQTRKVLMQAPKNGFFFVLDRTNGEFISAEKFATVTWASHVDESGRPVETDTDYREVAKFVRPSPYGAHSWPPMSFHPKTGLVYLPVRDMGSIYKMDSAWDYKPGQWNTGIDMAVYENFGSDESDLTWEAYLLAWDPVAQREVWRLPQITAFNGGTLSTADNLLFEGSADGRFVAYRASDGTKLWESPVGTGVMAGPITYEIAGDQYVAVAAGWGASFALSGGEAALRAKVRGGARVLAWKLGGEAPLPPGRAPLGPVPTPTYEITSTPAERRRGMILYQQECSVCHGPGAIGGGSGVPDLRYTAEAVHSIFSEILLEGLREAGGMPRFDDLFDEEEIHMIQAWILEQARIGSEKSASGSGS
ncbi:MAG: PQQ-dependent dehydrogenase, methanol/ethanol family [bacterium]|nr:PQQ-dependent dehydrogenase, methanol/ethanol family [Deltaproteobacteria bacterium]MCP4906319.1 PQQ-dependent dehydrogenase, methanol/ethanol family [bacterium]